MLEFCGSAPPPHHGPHQLASRQVVPACFFRPFSCLFPSFSLDLAQCFLAASAAGALGRLGSAWGTGLRAEEPHRLPRALQRVVQQHLGAPCPGGEVPSGLTQTPDCGVCWFWETHVHGTRVQLVLFSLNQAVISACFV